MPRIAIRVIILVYVCVLGHAVAVEAKTEGGQKGRVERRYEVVAWGKKQSLVDNLWRTYKAVSSAGTDWTVYQQRYKDLDFHWDEMKRKGIDPQKEKVYFDYIEWSEQKTGYSDHYVRFYVAARKLTPQQILANRFERYKRPELKKELEALDADTLGDVLVGVDRRTLQIGLTIIDRPTLVHALENVDTETLQVAIEVIDQPTLLNGITKIDRATLKHAIEVMDRKTLAFVLTNVDPATLKAIGEVVDDETYKVSLEIETNDDVRAKLAGARR